MYNYKNVVLIFSNEFSSMDLPTRKDKCIKTNSNKINYLHNFVIKFTKHP